jgi:hypothetical protein
MDPNGNNVGFIAEEDSLTSTMSRQLLRTHRKFNATIMNAQGEVVFKVRGLVLWYNMTTLVWKLGHLT